MDVVRLTARVEALAPVDAAARVLLEVCGRAAVLNDPTQIVEALTAVMEAVDAALDHFVGCEPPAAVAQVAAQLERDWRQLTLSVSDASG